MNPVKRILSDKYSRNKKVLMLLDYEDKDFKSKMIDEKEIPSEITIPFLHKGGSVLEVYNRRKIK
jgi:hypothetical protein